MSAHSLATHGDLGHVARAEQLDALGRHLEAVDCLVAGVRHGELEATTRLGKRLLAGDHAPELPREGLKLLREAAQRGSAEAPACLAVAAAIGLDGACELRGALGLLALAARRGWVPAQAQLRLLAGSAGSDDWETLAAHIDLAAWLRPPPAQELLASPRVHSYPGFVPVEVCDWIIGKARGRLAPAQMYDAVTRQTTAHASRTNSAAILGLRDTDLVLVLVQHRMAACLAVPFRHLEAATVLHYEPGQQIREHYDFVDPNVPDYERQLRERGQRIVTFLLYLNDGYEGGHTEFPRLGVSHKGARREGLFFHNAHADGRPDVRTLHAGRAPAGSAKWILTQFIKNRPAF